MSNLVERLVATGFTEYEAKVYVALQRCSPATGYQLAKESGVPRSTIYEVLGKLLARGAAVTQSYGDMVRYAPVPPDLLLDRMRHEFEDTLDDLADGLKRVVTTPGAPGQTWNVTGRENILSHARQMIERAQKQVAVVVGDDDQLDELLLWLQQAQARKLKLAVVSPVSYDAGDVPVTVHPQGPQLRQALGHGLTLVVDGREVLIGEMDRSESAVWTTNSYAVAWTLWCLREEMQVQPRRKRRTSNIKRQS
jgi:sugar-specific transcriptional regulator TrmB